MPGGGSGWPLPMGCDRSRDELPSECGSSLWLSPFRWSAFQPHVRAVKAALLTAARVVRLVSPSAPWPGTPGTEFDDSNRRKSPREIDPVWLFKDGAGDLFSVLSGCDPDSAEDIVSRRAPVLGVCSLSFTASLTSREDVDEFVPSPMSGEALTGEVDGVGAGEGL